jgi:hypothetical protein
MRVGRQSARTATTTIILMPVRRMGSTGPTTSWAASLWEPVRGTTGVIRLSFGDVAGAMKAGVATVAATGVAATKAERTRAAALWDVAMKAVD